MRKKQFWQLAKYLYLDRDIVREPRSCSAVPDLVPPLLGPESDMGAVAFGVTPEEATLISLNAVLNPADYRLVKIRPRKRLAGDAAKDVPPADAGALAKPAEPRQLPAPPASPLDNKPYVKVMEDLMRLSSEIRRLADHAPDDSRDALDYIYEQLEDVFERNGLTMIEGETVYDVCRHQPVPAALVPDGTPVEKTLVPGWALDRKVLRRAKVSVRKPDTDNLSN